MKKEELLVIAVLLLLPGCGGSDRCCDVSCPPPCETKRECDECDIKTYIDAHGLQITEQQDMQQVFEREIAKWEEELDRFTGLSEMDEFEMKAWADPELSTPVFMANDDSINQMSLQAVIERTVEEYAKAKQEGSRVCINCEELSWSELDKASAQILADELIAAGVNASDIQVTARVAEYDQSLPAHRLEVKLVAA